MFISFKRTNIHKYITAFRQGLWDNVEFPRMSGILNGRMFVFKNTRIYGYNRHIIRIYCAFAPALSAHEKNCVEEHSHMYP